MGGLVSQTGISGQDIEAIGSNVVRDNLLELELLTLVGLYMVRYYFSYSISPKLANKYTALQKEVAPTHQIFVNVSQAH